LTLLVERHDDEGSLVKLTLRLTEHPDVDGLGAAVRARAGHALETGLDVKVLAVRLENINELGVLGRWDLELAFEDVIEVLLLRKIAAVVVVVDLLEFLDVEESFDLLLLLDIGRTGEDDLSAELGE